MEERRKSPLNLVTRSEFEEFRAESKDYRCQQAKKLDSIHTAVFAKDDNNEFGMIGIQVIMQKFNQHLDMLCSFARIGKKTLKFLFWLITSAGGAVAAAKAAGWW